MDIKYSETLQHWYKEYLEVLRTTELKQFTLMINKNISPTLKILIKSFSAIEYKDGEFHAFYGDIMKNVNIFLNFLNDNMDSVVKTCKKHCDTVVDKNTLLDLIETCMDAEKAVHIGFCREYLPIGSPDEKKFYEDITMKYNTYLAMYTELSDCVRRFDRAVYVFECIHSEMSKCLKKFTEIFLTTHEFIGALCYSQVPKLRSSLRELMTRASKNLEQVRKESEKEYNAILHQLYDTNKKQLHLNRAGKQPSVEIAETVKVITDLQYQLETWTKEGLINALKKEVDYWQCRSQEFETSVQAVEMAYKDLMNLMQLEKAHHDSPHKCINPRMEMSYCWKISLRNVSKRKKEILEKLKASFKGFLINFGVRGCTHQIHEDDVGKFYIDEYKHRVYLFNHGLDAYHVKCDGNFEKASRVMHALDTVAERYVTDSDGEKLYQRAPCGSCYKLGDNNLLVKVTEDCGHSERPNKDCRMEAKDPRMETILPPAPSKPINIEKTMTPDDVKYLWECFGGILPHALNDVATVQPRNPVHFFAHQLLKHRHGVTKQDYQKKHEDAQAYREDILRKRKEKAIAEAKAWKAKQGRRAVPEDLDDAYEVAVRNAVMASTNVIHDINYDDDQVFKPIIRRSYDGSFGEESL